MLLNLGQPHVQVREALLLEEVEAEDDSLGPLVVRIRDRSVSLLPRRVPDLKLNLAAAVIDRAEAEVHSNRRRVVLDKVIVGEAHKKARFADTGVSEEHQLEQVVVLFST